jgi:hypothetical protein
VTLSRKAEGYGFRAGVVCRVAFWEPLYENENYAAAAAVASGNSEPRLGQARVESADYQTDMQEHTAWFCGHGFIDAAENCDFGRTCREP